MKISQFTIAGKLSDGSTVYFGKKDSSDPTAPDLGCWVSLNPAGPHHDYVRLEFLGLTEPWDAPGFVHDYNHAGFVAKGAAVVARVASFLGNLNPALFHAWSNAAILDHLGEAYPDIPACLAAGQTPEHLAATTADAVNYRLSPETAGRNLNQHER